MQIDEKKFVSGYGDCYETTIVIMGHYGITLGTTEWFDVSNPFTAALTINRHVNAGRPIQVKVSHSDGSEHWVVVVGRGWLVDTDSADGGYYYYTYIDPLAPNSTVGCDYTANRLVFHVNNDMEDYFGDLDALGGTRYDVVGVLSNDGKPYPSSL